MDDNHKNKWLLDAKPEKRQDVAAKPRWGGGPLIGIRVQVWLRPVPLCWGWLNKKKI